MADFCMDSMEELSDVAGLCAEDEVYVILCEGCGVVHPVDNEGYAMIWSGQEKKWVRANRKVTQEDYPTHVNEAGEPV